MSATLVRETHAAYRRLRRFIPLGVLRSEKEYRKAVAILDEIIPEATGPEVLRSLMGAHGLTQSDLPEIGSQGSCQKFSPANANSTFDRSGAWRSDSGSPLPSSSPPHKTRRDGSDVS